MKMYINGKAVDASDGQVIEVFAPATGKKIDEVPRATAEDIREAIRAAQEGKCIWAATPLYERCRILSKYADLIEEHRHELTELLMQDNGKSRHDAETEMLRIDVMIRGFAEHAAHLYTDCLTDAQPGMEHSMFVTRREPLGVVACIVPFNHPASLYTQKVAPALAMGNAVIIKPASDAPLTVIRLTELLYEAGVPGSVAQVITAKGSDVGNILVPDPSIDAVTLTGSTEAGVAVTKASAEHLHHVMLELGGNDAFIFFGGSDMDKAIEELVESRATCAGQSCGSSKRLLIQNSAKEEFTKKLCERLSRIKIGDPDDPETEVGCLITEKAAKEVEEQVQHTIEQGAKCALGGHRNGAFFEMTVLTDVTPDMDIAKDMEVFGPVFPIIGFDTKEEAVEIANASKYGLGGSVMSTDITEAFYIADHMQCGSVVINGVGPCRPPEVAFGGYKMSGLGREGVCATLEEMSQLKNYILKNVR